MVKAVFQAQVAQLVHQEGDVELAADPALFVDRRYEWLFCRIRSQIRDVLGCGCLARLTDDLFELVESSLLIVVEAEDAAAVGFNQAVDACWRNRTRRSWCCNSRRSKKSLSMSLV